MNTIENINEFLYGFIPTIMHESNDTMRDLLSKELAVRAYDYALVFHPKGHNTQIDIMVKPNAENDFYHIPVRVNENVI